MRWSVAFVAFAALLIGGRASAETPVERGRYLVEVIAACGNCHTPVGPEGKPLPGKHLAGGLVIEEQPFTAVVPNITSDRQTGIGAWTDGQIITAIREGVKPDGTVIRPPMPIALYRGLSDDDVGAIVAYLRTVPAVANKPTGQSTYRIALPPSYGPPVGHVVAPPQTDTVAYGGYLFGPVAHCAECHTPQLESGALDMTRVGLGGREFQGPWGVSVSANITPDKETGLGLWSDAEIERAIRTGVSRDGRALFPPMAFPYYRNTSASDMTALIAYIRTLKPIAR